MPTPARLPRVLLPSLWAVGVFAGLLPATGSGQVFVYPERAGQSNVRHETFEWLELDAQVTVDGGTGGGGVRLYFYEEERAVAERALATISEAYREMVQTFDFVPTRTFPYILYSSYQEFLQTNLFPLQEGILGVTSPVDLKLALPYFGDHRLFRDVGAHEMAHQFTIQKVKSLTEEKDAPGDPLGRMPLWFVEGLAEYYAQGGLDPEAEMRVRDLVTNPNAEQGYVLIDFFEDRPQSVLWTYKVGQARCAFLEYTYGPKTLQRILNHAPELTRTSRQGFRELLARVTGDDAAILSSKFDAWVKRRAFRAHLQAGQDLHSFPALSSELDLGGTLEAMAASPDGALLALRTLSHETGESRLFLVDRRKPSDAKLVTVDNVPGVESLHPISRRNFALSSSALAFIAESQGRDTLTVEEVSTADGIRLKGRRTFELGRLDIRAADSPSFSPDGKRVAFVGLDSKGEKDVFVLDVSRSPDEAHLLRLTHDVHSERQLSWGPQGIVFSSDATSHGKYNLFRVRPEEAGSVERLTSEERDELDPLVLPDGRVFFAAYEAGHLDAYEVVGDGTVRRTDAATGVTDLAPGPNGGLSALLFRSGQKTPVSFSKESYAPALLKPNMPPGSPGDIPRASLAGSQPYRAASLVNWELGTIFGVVGAGGGEVVGQFLASANDRLRNHAVLLNVLVFGSFELLDGYLLYLNQERRVTFAAGPFQSLRFRVDQTFAESLRFISGERFFGGTATARYPFNRFVYAEGGVAAGGAAYFVTPGVRAFLKDPDANGTGFDLYAPWHDANQEVRFQTEETVGLGFDTLRYASFLGPHAGSSLLLQGTLAEQPTKGELFGNARLDGEHFFPLFSRTQLMFRLGVGTTFGNHFARQFFLSSFDTLRGVRFGDDRWLLGRHYGFSTAELQLPLNTLVRVVLLTDVQGIAGVDFGGVGDQLGQAWDKRVLDLVLGFNFAFGPLLFRLHFAKPLDTGASFGLPVPRNEWVTNFSLRLAGLEWLFGKRTTPQRTEDTARAVPATALAGSGVR